MNEDIQERIVHFLKETYKPIAIILHGSRVGNVSASQADWDIVLVTEKEEKGGPVLYEGERLDVSFANPTDEMIKNGHGYPIARATLLFDTNNCGETMLEKTKKSVKMGRRFQRMKEEIESNDL